jgi:hypothetical protein
MSSTGHELRVELRAAAQAILDARSQWGEYNSMYNLDEEFARLRKALAALDAHERALP